LRAATAALATAARAAASAWNVFGASVRARVRRVRVRVRVRVRDRVSVRVRVRVRVRVSVSVSALNEPRLSSPAAEGASTSWARVRGTGVAARVRGRVFWV
jgi:hypothetical protein